MIEYLCNKAYYFIIHLTVKTNLGDVREFKDHLLSIANEKVFILSLFLVNTSCGQL